MITGLFGTGKITFLTQLILAFCAMGIWVLVCYLSNTTEYFVTRMKGALSAHRTLQACYEKNNTFIVVAKQPRPLTASQSESQRRTLSTLHLIFSPSRKTDAHDLHGAQACSAEAVSSLFFFSKFEYRNWILPVFFPFQFLPSLFTFHYSRT